MLNTSSGRIDAREVSIPRYPLRMEETAGPILDLRRVRYFVAVAEELHFGRAAARLYITQPVLSRQIRLLEQELGIQLFERSSREVTLTVPGEQLLEDGRMLLSAAEAARRRCVASSEARATLTIGFWGHEWIAPALRRFATEFPAVDAQLRRIAWDDQIDVLHDGRVDVAFVALPVDTRGLELLPFQRDQRVAALPVDHPAADRSEISIDDLADDPVIIQGGATEEWNAFHNVDPRPDGSHPRRGPVAGNFQEKLELVAAGAAISFLPESVAKHYIPPGIVYVPVPDIPPIEICIAWKPERSSRLVDGFMRAVRSSGSTSSAQVPPPALTAR
jgi:DNA-binding transcriptional LysR family regulator